MPPACLLCPPAYLLACRAWAAAPPDEYKGQSGDARWCAPYAYKERLSLGCGGADRWTVVPSDPFPGTWWWAGSGSIFCEGGRYCPNTTTMLDCTQGHFCRQVELAAGGGWGEGWLAGWERGGSAGRDPGMTKE